MSEFLARDRRALLHSQHRVVPDDDLRVWVRGAGTTVFDADGRAYFDGLSGLWNVNLGYGRRELIDAAARQMGELPFASSFAGETHPRAIELAERLRALTYAEHRVFFTCGGAEALEAALRTARYVQHRRGRATKTGFLVYDRAYHGTTLATASAGGNAEYRRLFAPDVPEFYSASTPGAGDRGLEAGESQNPSENPRAASRTTFAAERRMRSWLAQFRDAKRPRVLLAALTLSVLPQPPAPSPQPRSSLRSSDASSTSVPTVSPRSSPSRCGRRGERMLRRTGIGPGCARCAIATTWCSSPTKWSPRSAAAARGPRCNVRASCRTSGASPRGSPAGISRSAGWRSRRMWPN
ncbi:MAG: aminotransferase class III-fold pyridoxal phosphate-dependent enzyme [Pirellulales bacterium]